MEEVLKKMVPGLATFEPGYVCDRGKWVIFALENASAKKTYEAVSMAKSAGLPAFAVLKQKFFVNGNPRYVYRGIGVLREALEEK